MKILMKHELVFYEDCGKYYWLVLKDFRDNWGYNLAYNEMLEEGRDYTSKLITKYLLDEQKVIQDKCDELDQDLIKRISAFAHHKFAKKQSNSKLIGEVLDNMNKLNKVMPNRTSMLQMFQHQYYKKDIKPAFNAVWKELAAQVLNADWIKEMNQFSSRLLQTKDQEFKDKLKIDIEEEYAKAVEEYEKIGAWDNDAEKYAFNWRKSPRVVPPLADALTQHLGVGVTIMLYGPREDGEIDVQSVTAIVPSSCTKQNLVQFNRREMCHSCIVNEKVEEDEEDDVGKEHMISFRNDPSESQVPSVMLTTVATTSAATTTLSSTSPNSTPAPIQTQSTSSLFSEKETAPEPTQPLADEPVIAPTLQTTQQDIPQDLQGKTIVHMKSAFDIDYNVSGPEQFMNMLYRLTGHLPKDPIPTLLNVPNTYFPDMQNHVHTDLQSPPGLDIHHAQPYEPEPQGEAERLIGHLPKDSVLTPLNVPDIYSSNMQNHAHMDLQGPPHLPTSHLPQTPNDDLQPNPQDPMDQHSPHSLPPGSHDIDPITGMTTYYLPLHLSTSPEGNIVEEDVGTKVAGDKKAVSSKKVTSGKRKQMAGTTQQAANTSSQFQKSAVEKRKATIARKKAEVQRKEAEAQKEAELTGSKRNADIADDGVVLRPKRMKVAPAWYS
uniref:Uncharacterized protein n=1 Tax=Moniliophthora roreri TaxID=221103 RepID=A0A0W0FI40_MONRR